MKISLSDFGNVVNDFYLFMGRDKTPSNARLSMVYDKISKYDGIDIRLAISYMGDNLDSIPHNLAKSIKRALYEVNNEKPENQQQVFKNGQYGKCDDCNGTGCFKVVMFDEFKNRYEPLVPCSNCDNHKGISNDPVFKDKRMSATELTEAGYKFKPFNKCLLKSKDLKPMVRPKAIDIESLAVELGEDKRINEGKKYKNRFIDPEMITEKMRLNNDKS